MSAVRLPARIDESLTLRRAAHRLVRRRAPAPPQRPVSAKLELTHRCNLRCSFCYTDSPRRTLEGTLDLPGEDWLALADDACELGIESATVTGGEPLLRRELALDLLRRMAAGGIAVHLNTNGWFVDDPAADALAAVPGLGVSISVDGASPSVHDAARGVPGSWRRAVGAIDRLLTRGLPVRVAMVVTPANADGVPDLLDQMHDLAVERVTLTPVVPIGAAAREGRWRVSRRAIVRAGREHRRRRGPGMAVALQTGALESLAARERLPPRTILVRPNGSVGIDSVQPFSFGHVSEGLGTCWDRVLAAWDDPRVAEWARSIPRAAAIRKAPVVPYRDEEVAIAGPPVPRAATRNSGRGALLGPPVAAGAPGDLDQARRHVSDLARARVSSPPRPR